MSMPDPSTPEPEDPSRPDPAPAAGTDPAPAASAAPGAIPAAAPGNDGTMAPDEQAAATATTALCRNCDTPLLGPHCHACGQPVKGLVRPLSGWLADFLDTMFSLDGRLWRSIGPLLLRPGHLTREYLAGRRVRQVTPVRLFLFLIIVLLVVVQLNLNITREQFNANLAPLPEDRERIGQMLDWLPQASRQAVLHEMLNPVMPSEPGLAVDYPGEPPAAGEFVPPQWLPAALHGIAESAHQRLHHNLVRISNDRGLLVRQFFQVAPYVLFFMPPLYALLLKLAYLFRRRLYLEHLLVALHGHSVIALGLILMLLLAMLGRWQGDRPGVAAATGIAIVLLQLWLLIHLLLTQKRIYGQGWPMTLFKFTLLAVAYLVMLALAGVVALMIGVMSV